MSNPRLGCRTTTAMSTPGGANSSPQIYFKETTHLAFEKFGGVSYWIWEMKQRVCKRCCLPLEPGHISACLGTVSRMSTKYCVWWEVMHSSEAHTQKTQAQPQRSWEALSLSTGLGQILFASRGCGFTSGSLPRPLGPSARLVSAPHDCLYFPSASGNTVFQWFRCVSGEVLILFELEQDCWFSISSQEAMAF